MTSSWYSNGSGLYSEFAIGQTATAPTGPDEILAGRLDDLLNPCPGREASLRTAVRDGIVEDERWVCDTLDKADWASRRLAAARRKLEVAKAAYDRQLEVLDQFLRDAQAEKDRAERFFEHHLLQFHLAQIDEDDTATTIKLPGGGRLVAPHKAGSVAVDIQDEAQARQWAEANDLLDQITKRDLSKSLIAEHLLAHGEEWVVPSTGEVVPGLRARQPMTKWKAVTP